jgi:hypothetical protein
MTGYSSEVERQMECFYHSLSEKDRRRYAAVEAVKLGHGGKKYICSLLGCHFDTLVKGINELDCDQSLAQTRIRNVGGGRKNIAETTEGLHEAFLRVLKNNTAGSPMDESVKWTNLSRSQIAELLEKEGFSVGVSVVDDLLEKNNFRKRKPFKNVAGGNNEFRDDQFKNIERLKQEYEAQGNPVISMDVKKRVDR